MKKKSLRMVVVLLLFTMIFVPLAKVETNAAATSKKNVTVKKPGKVKGLRKVKMNCKWDGHANVSAVKISFKKVKGASGYQVLIYQKDVPKGYRTPLLYAKNTKKTTYTIKNTAPNHRYTIKVRAYKKGKNGKIVYGKAKSILVKTPGKMKGCYYTCDTCIAAMPGNAYRMLEHFEDVDKVHHELHAGGTYFWR